MYKVADFTNVRLQAESLLQIIVRPNPRKFWHCEIYFPRARSHTRKLRAILLYTSTILLYAHLKNIALKISQRYLQGTFSGYFSVVPHSREYFAYTCKGYDLEHEVFLTRKILSLFYAECCVSGRKSTPILSASARSLNNTSRHNFTT